MNSDSELRVLLVAATARDGEITRSLLTAEHLACVVCGNVRQVTAEIDGGVGAILLTEEVFGTDGLEELLAKLRQQESWSDIPIVIMMRGERSSPAAVHVLGSLTNVTLLERPAPTRSVVSAVQAAVRGRARQYQIREQINEIRDAQERFQTLANFIPQLTWMARPDGWVFWYNKRWHDYCGTTPEAMEGWGWQSVHDPGMLPQVLKIWRDSLETGEPFDMIFPLKGGDGRFRQFLTRAVPFRDARGEITLWFGTNTDVSDQKRSEEANAKFRTFFDQGTYFAGVMTVDGTLIEANRLCLDACGFSREEVIGRKFWDCGWWNRSPELIEMVRAGSQQAAEGRVFRRETIYFTADGSERVVDLTIAPVADDSGRILFVAPTWTDITDKKRMADERERLLDAERAARTAAEQAGRLKDEFLATLSHELRTPLNAIFGWAQILRRHAKTNVELDEGLAVIERNSRVQAQLIEDLLDMSRIVSGKLRLELRQVDIADITNAAIESVLPAAVAKEIRLQKILDTHLRPVRGDPSRLQQVVWNLLSNAIKFTPKGGRVQVTVQQVNSHAEICVADSGMGIKPEFLPYVFDRFRQADASTTRRYGGLGLGLAIVKNLVELHGGTVGVRSSGEDQGTTFAVELPLMVVNIGDASGLLDRSIRAREDAIAEIACNEDVLEGVSVLVLDDEEDARRLIARVLEECNARVIVASSGAEAREILIRERPAVLICDIGMPNEDGYDFIRKVRRLSDQQGGKTPAAALTAFARSEDRTRALRAGFQSHVAKPVEPAELVAVVASLAGRTVHTNSH